MATGILHSAVVSLPANLFIFQLAASSAAIGLTSPLSPVRPLTLPFLAASTYGIVKTAALHLRPRWAPLLGGLSFSLLLRYLDVGLITRWSYETQAPTANISPGRTNNSKAQTDDETKNTLSATSSPETAAPSPPRKTSLWTRFAWGWNLLWSFRQANTPYEVRNTPLFSSADPAHVPSKWTFVVQKSLLASACYLVLDLLAQRPPPSDAAAIFNPALIPFFRRLGEVTWPQVKLRAIFIVMFGATFYCVIQGAYSLAAAATVAAGVSEPSSWRPLFGAFADAYSLGNFWGKVWHQNLRGLVGVPASYLVYNLLGLRRGSRLAAASSTMLAFTISGVLHLAAAHTSGMPLSELGVVQFFCTQALGIIVEGALTRLLRSASVQGNGNGRSSSGDVAAGPGLPQRLIGYFWVLAFLTWSGPVWLYPQAARQRPQAGKGSFVPYSIVRAWTAR